MATEPSKGILKQGVQDTEATFTTTMASSSKTNAASSGRSTSPVYFWRETEEPFGCFSQWYQKPFTEPQESGESVTFETAEQYMMYHKAILFDDPSIATQILGARTGRKQRALGRQVHDFDESTWSKNRSRIVQSGNLLKFSQDEELKRILLETGDREIVEASPRDRIWGIGYGAKNAPSMREKWGLNLLGKVLMEVRKQIREEQGEEDKPKKKKARISND
ncbi:hypothetical protein FGG08_002939 [Glutinoglossum americanum]|uniref:NADAR domain-containing protein n=1 Tax=Glutinoglossum americanum TaxID=1670608 RepID=A0A9P8L166_9PEZI|nr:hypothetical protein FGG08_002939 [Glutinoglossum americanum]